MRLWIPVQNGFSYIVFVIILTNLEKKRYIFVKTILGYGFDSHMYQFTSTDVNDGDNSLGGGRLALSRGKLRETHFRMSLETE